MNALELRKIDRNGLAELQAIGRITFQETFAGANSPEDMAKYVEEQFSTQRVLAELVDPHSQFFLAEREGRTIGYLKLNSGAAQTEPMGEDAVEIERIYVLREFHGHGVGQRLCNKALEVAHTLGAETIWLGVWERNPQAIAFYRRNGFAEFGEHVFKLGDDEQRDVLMRRSVGSEPDQRPEFPETGR